MLGKRVAVSAVLIPLLILLFWIDARFGASAPVLFGLCLLLGLRSAWELTELLRVRTMMPSFRATAVCVGSLLVATWLPHWYPATDGSRFCPFQESLSGVLLMTAASILALFLVRALRFECHSDGERPQMESLGAELLTVGYAGVLLSVTAQHRWLASGGGAYLALASVVVAAKSGDIGAYCLGRWLGRAKLSPRLSPGKTRVGAAGAILGGCLGSWAWLHFAPPLFDDQWSACPALWSLVFGAVLAGVGLIGDLCESLIKRDVGKKDAAALLPEFGGVLDLLDSVLFAGPVSYMMWLYLPLAPWSSAG